MDLHSFGSRARKDSRHQRFRRESGAHRRQLRSSEPSLLADRRRASMGFRQRQPASLLCRGIEDRWLRNRRATGMAPARQRRLSHGRRIANRQDQEGVRRTGKTRACRGEGSEVLRSASDGLFYDFDCSEDWQLGDRAPEADDHCALAGVYETERPIAPKLAEFERYLQQSRSPSEIPGVIAEATGVGA